MITIGRGQPLSDNGRWDVGSTGDVLVLVDQTVAADAGNATFRLTIVTSNGSRTVRHLRYVPVDARALHDSVIAGVVPRPADGRAPDIEAVRAALLLPAFRPAVTQVLVGRDGRIWLQREFGYAPEVVWDVLDRKGTPVGYVRLPRNVRLLEADAGHLWGVYPDPDDVPVLVRYALRSPSSRR